MKKFYQDLLATNILHKPLTVHKEESFESESLKKEKIIQQVPILGEWEQIGRGKLVKDDALIHLKSPARFETYPADWPQDGDYTSFGMIGAKRIFANENWESFNQLKLVVTSNCKNIINPAITISFTNDGKIKVPDKYDREGHHVINLENKKTQEYRLNLSNLSRDAISKLEITFNANGSYMNLPAEWDIVVEQVFLETNQEKTNVKGWQLLENDLSYSHIGYPKESTKTVIAHNIHIGEKFRLVSKENSENVYEGIFKKIDKTVGTYAIADFSDYEISGEYHFQVGDLKTKSFKIADSENLLKSSLWKSLNFVFCERCGCPVSGIHGTCHQDVYAEFNDRKIIFNGGWHDAGDLSQQLVQSAEVTLGIFELAEKVKNSDPVLYARLLEEGEWGLDFIFKTRLGNGYRLTSAGVSRWTDNQIGSMDDAKARVYNSPYDNFLITGILAKIYLSLPEESDLREKIASILEIDYEDALTEFKKAPFVHEPISWEHTYSTSKSTYLATMIWTAALLYQITDKVDYQLLVEQKLVELLACQETDGISLFDGTLLKGMFYRDEKKKVFQHFNHQAREHLYAYAMTEAQKIITDEELKVKLSTSVSNYGAYLKYLMNFTAPYPMIASGIYEKNEWEDKESFDKQHLLVGPEAKIEFQEQLVAGEQIAGNYYIKRFPVWFSFRGNSAVLLSMGESAALLGKLLGDKSLTEISYQQLEWLIGKNPFGQSMMFGEGHQFPEMYTVSSGEIVGEMPVGVQTFENEDAPYWPQFNNATYKEVWVGLAGKWFTLVSKLLEEEEYEKVIG
ncbi:glycoside hydrolase family 9 protein [Lactococcus cremoris]|uniref:Glycoside hydrolase family 9 protein n=1 Tax=Lactococcus lactis subsp. cremoris TaxID=1359 RepID=A0AAX4ACQ1_LACLC|nr:glycoside hydrolase family 9 protein [Lactococcus cremoris]KGH34454.1 endoglucanase [Lactococcus cremoris]QSE64553.1 glycoside hydrolase family 9 protein [Lactococcus cremoris]WMX70253.1 glycoside hydrolase family 9 protein [Lactococcus cremoris]